MFLYTGNVVEFITDWLIHDYVVSHVLHYDTHDALNALGDEDLKLT